ncbi:MAG: protein kinase domain-containing protein, partial [Candidatus Binatia bacterium]
MSRRTSAAGAEGALPKPGALASGGIVAAGRYHIKRLLGEGAKKRVFLAHDMQLDRDVAIGVLKAGQLDPVALDRIRREAQAMARLGDHPGIVSVYDIVSESGVPFIVSQYMAGGTLHDWLAGFPDRRPPLDAVLRVGQEICAALSHAHANGIIHRDVKPTNVWLTRTGSARLGDFGLAISTDQLATDGVMVGTVAYMAPEQALGKPSEPRTDLYSVGSLLYEMATGQPPFVGETALSVLSQHIHSTPVPPSRLVPNLPRALETLILNLLAKTPDGRPQTAAVVQQMLRACESGIGSAVAISPTPLTGDSVFVGREREMSELRTGVEEVIAGHGRLFLIGGDPGIGKTRLVEQLTAYARGRDMRVLVGRCYEGEGAPAFWAWVQAIRAHADARTDDVLRREMGSGAAAIARIVPEIAQRFADLRPEPRDDSEQNRFRLFEAITHFLKTASTSEPLMLVLDDLHWA